MFDKNYYGFVALALAYISVIGSMPEDSERAKKNYLDAIIEFKGAYFSPSNSLVKDIYHGGALFGPEVTVRLWKHWYGFASIDFLKKKGKSLGFCSPTTLNLFPLAIGLKYMHPFCYGDVYGGLGFQPTHVNIKNDSPYVIKKQSKWGFGGIGKLGVYIKKQKFIPLPRNCVLDLFIDYSLTKKITFCGTQAPTGSVVPRKVNISGLVFGAGLGYRFN